MPIYTAQCRKCGREQDYFAKIAELNNTPKCCGVKTKKILTPTHIAGDLPDYQSPIDGRVVHGRAGRKRDLERSGCRPFEGVESEQRAAREFRERKDRELDKRLTEQLSASYEGMTPDSKKQLEFLTNDVSTERG